MIEHGIENVFLHPPNKGFQASLGDLTPDMHRWPEAYLMSQNVLGPDLFFLSGYNEALFFACDYTIAVFKHNDGSFGAFD